MAGRRHSKHHHEEHENHERWLVSGYDMMTLLFAVFVVLFAISSTNVSKIKALEQSLQEAFSGPVFSGGKAMIQTGDTSSDDTKSSPSPPLPSLTPVQAVTQAIQDAKNDSSASAASQAAEARQAAAEEKGFEDLKAKIDRLVAAAGLDDKVSTTVSLRGLKVRLLTDKLFFASGSASINPQAVPTLEKIGHIIAAEREHPVEVEGHTDTHPIATSQYPSNWQLSGARAGAVVQRLAAAGVAPRRMSLAGYAAEDPVATNATAPGRARNRRVEIVLTRMHGADTAQGGTTP
jgi:chemotaxis protein MotB